MAFGPYSHYGQDCSKDALLFASMLKQVSASSFCCRPLRLVCIAAFWRESRERVERLVMNGRLLQGEPQTLARFSDSTDMNG